MTPAEEDALIERFAVDCFDNPNCDDVRESFRLAIRAAVAAEQERREQLEAALREILARHKPNVKMSGPEPCRCKTCAIANRALIGEA